MFIERIYLKNFRNLRSVLLDFNPDLNIIVGGNGQGKTNLLEAIYYLSTGRSHRTSTDKELINFDNEDTDHKLIIQAKIKRADEVNQKLSLQIEGRDKFFKVNDLEIEKMSNFIGRLNVVLFSPEDLQLVKGSPGNRRNFLDTEVSQVNPYYYHQLKKYEKVLKQRNNLLKEIRYNPNKDRSILEVYTSQLIEIGSNIMKKRQEVVEKLKLLARLHQRRLTDNKENLKLKYEPSFSLLEGKKINDLFKQEVENNLNQEIERGYTLVGPHRDDLLLEINNYDIRKYGSQGQQRTAALALKLAELEFMKSESGEYPVLLLDDVFSELDSIRRKQLIDFIGNKIQTFITTTDKMLVEDFANNEDDFYYIKAGEFH
ncbi:MAG: DNA replication/repair protein RecF [Bacillota bacterium]